MSRLILVLFFLSGCAISATAPQTKDPFVLTVQSEQYAVTSLRAVGELKGRVAWDPQTVFVKVKGFSSGVQIKEEKLSITERVGITNTVAANEIVTVPIALEAPDLTDYQIEVSWGEAPIKRREKVVLENLKFNKINTDCKAERCPITYVVECDLVNDTSQVLVKVELGVGYIWQKVDGNVDLQEQKLENSKLERVLLSTLKLDPGERQALKLNLETPIQQPEGGQYVPTVKILASNG